MESRAELSSIATQLGELTRRVTAIGEGLDRPPTEEAATALYETERSLRAGARSLDRARRALG